MATIREYVVEALNAGMTPEDTARQAQERFPHRKCNRSYVMRIAREVSRRSTSCGVA